jgi:hypothetical protein
MRLTKIGVCKISDFEVADEQKQYNDNGFLVSPHLKMVKKIFLPKNIILIQRTPLTILHGNKECLITIKITVI